MVKKENVQKLQHISERRCLGEIGIKQSKPVVVFAPKKKDGCLHDLFMCKWHAGQLSDNVAGKIPAFFCEETDCFCKTSIRLMT